MKTVIIVMALVLLMVIIVGCASAGSTRPSIPVAMPWRCDLHYDWQCRNTEKWLACSMNEQCIKDNEVAI